MKRTLPITIFTLLVASCCMGQQKEIDSLHTLLSKHPQKDTVRFLLLTDLSYYYNGIDPKKGVQYADEALALTEYLHDKKRIAQAYSVKASSLRSTGNDSSALVFYNKAVTLHNASGNKIGAARSINNIGLIYNGKSDYAKAIQYHSKAALILADLGQTNMLGTVYNSLGVNYWYLSDYSRALDYYIKSLKIKETEGDYNLTANIVSNIGLIFKDMQNYKQSLAYHYKSLEYFKKVDNQKGMANTYGNIGVVFDLQDNPSAAIRFFRRQLAICKAIDDKLGAARAMNNIAVSDIDLKKYDEALDFLLQSVRYYQTVQNRSDLAGAYAVLGELCMTASDSILTKHGIASSNRVRMAISYYKKSLALNIETGHLSGETIVWKNLSAAYEANKDFPNALYAANRGTHLKDSLFTSEKKSEIARKEMRYEQEKREAVLKAEHKAEVKQQQTTRNAITGGAGILAIASIASFVFYKHRRDADERQKEAELKAEISDTEMKLLRLQMNPHFIFNSLNSISDYVNKHDPETADQYLSKFAKLMRMTLENSEKKEVPLSEDLTALELYMQLEALRLANRFTYEIVVSESINAEETLVPPLILQPFVENSIWHGIAPKQGAGRILICVKTESKMIICTVEDDGIGRVKALQNSQQESEPKSMGIKITKSRIDILNKIKNTDAALAVTDLENGTRVEVRLPYETTF
jgi:sensor histidine kinase YesM